MTEPNGVSGPEPTLAPPGPAAGACVRCGKPLEEEPLICPHCGAAQIPQFNQKDLRELRDRFTAGDALVRRATVLGLLSGFLLGLVGFFVLLGYSDEPDYSKSWARFLPGIVVVMTIMGGLAGALGAFAVNRWRARRPAPRKP